MNNQKAQNVIQIIKKANIYTACSPREKCL